MDTTKIVALKQEQISLDSRIQELSKKMRSKQVYLFLGILSLILTFIIFVIGSGEGGSGVLIILLFLFAILAITFFILAFAGRKNSKDQLIQSKSRLQDIKLELVKLEHSV